MSASVSIPLVVQHGEHLPTFGPLWNQHQLSVSLAANPTIDSVVITEIPNKANLDLDQSHVCQLFCFDRVRNILHVSSRAYGYVNECNFAVSCLGAWVYFLCSHFFFCSCNSFWILRNFTKTRCLKPWNCSLFWKACYKVIHYWIGSIYWRMEHSS